MEIIVKKSKILLYLSSLLILIHFAGHLIGHLSWKVPKDANMQNAVAAMIQNKANYMGAYRSFADFYHGYSLILFVVYILSIWVLMVLANGIRKDIRFAKSVLLPFGIAYISFAVIEFRQFFLFAASISALTGLLILLSMLSLRRY